MEAEADDDNNNSDVLVAIAAVYFILVAMVGGLYFCKQVGGKEAIMFVLGPLLAPLVGAAALIMIVCALVLLIPAVFANCLLGLCLPQYTPPPIPYPNFTSQQNMQPQRQQQQQQQPALDKSSNHATVVQEILIVRELLRLDSGPLEDVAKQFRHCQGPITVLRGSKLLRFSEPAMGTATTTTNQPKGALQEPTDKAETTPVLEGIQVQDNIEADSTPIWEEEGETDVERGIPGPSMNESSAAGTPIQTEEVENQNHLTQGIVNILPVSPSHTITEELTQGGGKGGDLPVESGVLEHESLSPTAAATVDSVHETVETVEEEFIHVSNDLGTTEQTQDGPTTSLKTPNKNHTKLHSGFDANSNTLPETQEDHPGPPPNEPMSVDAAKSPDTCCSICLEEFQKGDFVAWSKKNLDCPHMYHYHCLKNWLERKNHCPICRRKYI